MFLTMLHLANKKILHLNPSENEDDFEIYKHWKKNFILIWKFIFYNFLFFFFLKSLDEYKKFIYFFDFELILALYE
jgi:hypothetical protein